MRLTEITAATSANSTDLIHIVKTGDTTQFSGGSSYKIEIGDYKSIFATPDTYITGGTYNAGTAIFTNNTGGTFNVSGFSTGSTGGTSYWSAGTGNNAVATVNGGNVASGDYAVAEGRLTNAIGNSSHTEGYNTLASNTTSHAEGDSTIASGIGSHAQGGDTEANGGYSHASGYRSQANGQKSFVHGSGSTVNGDNSIVLGNFITGNSSNTTYVDNFNIKTVPVGIPINNLGIDTNGRVVIGFSTGGTSYWSAGTGNNAVATVNGGNVASGDYAVAEGRLTNAIGNSSHTEGQSTIATGSSSHAEGGFTRAYGSSSHAEGDSTIASGGQSHAEGIHTLASGDASHAEGYYSRAIGLGSHAGGGSFIIGFSGGTAIGRGSFVHGDNSYSVGDYSIVLGRAITGNTADTTYVDNLNIKTVPSGPGTIDLGVNAGGFVVNQASDIRLKENINTIENALDIVMNLRGVTYNWKDRLNGGDDLRIGFIAQEVQEVIPELITQNGEYLGVQYKDVPALLVEAIKELTAKISDLENTIIELKNK